MKRRLFISPRADQDVDEQFAYIYEENPAAAERFLSATFQSFDDLLEAPFKGRKRYTPRPSLKTCVSGLFKNFRSLIFYRVTDETVLIVGFLHSLRDLKRVLQESDSPD